MKYIIKKILKGHGDMWLGKFVSKEQSHYVPNKSEAQVFKDAKQTNKVLKVLGNDFEKEKIKK